MNQPLNNKLTCYFYFSLENLSDTTIINKDEMYINDDVPNTAQEQLDDEKQLKIATENINLEMTFNSWDEVEVFLEDYGRRNGFTINKYRMEKNKTTQVITKRTFTCEFGGKFKSKKKESALQAGTQRNTRTKKRQCPWHINFRFPERATNISISLFVNEHNHELRPDTFEFSSKYRELSKEMMDEVELMTKHGNLSITVQRNLLKGRFPNMNYTDSDLSNAIQRIKNLNRSNMHNDASDLLISLVQKKQADPHFFLNFELDIDNRLTRLFWMTSEQITFWIKYHDVIINDNTAKTNVYNMPLSVFVGVDNNGRTRLLAQAIISDETFETYQWILQCTLQATDHQPVVFFTDADPAMDAAVPIKFPDSYHAHCIYHIGQNLPKNLKAKLGNLYNDFIGKFYKCRNSHCETLFFARWNDLLENFPLAKDYLLRVLWPTNKSWARCYLRQIFTAGIESTSRVEGMNGIIKRTLRSNSTLCQLVECLSERLVSETQKERFHGYKIATTSSASLSMGEELFPNVTKILEKYVTVNTLTAIKNEMSQCLYLQATILSFSKMDFQEPVSIICE